MALPLPASNKVDTRTIAKPANEIIRGVEWNQLVQAVGELQGLTAGIVISLPVMDVATVPAAGPDLAGRMIVVTQSGEPTLVQACVPNSSGGYEWVSVQQSS